MTKILYITDKDTWSSALHLFSESHWIEAEADGKILVACAFTSETNVDAWESLPGVEALPHPTLEKSKPILVKHAKMLGHIGVVDTDGTFEVAKKAGAVHPGLRPSRI